VGKVTDSTKKLVEVTSQATKLAIAIVRPGIEFNAIGDIIQTVADRYRYGIVRDYCGHGIGSFFHGPPLVIHYKNNYNFGKMKAGMVFTIEPMITEGKNSCKVLSDKWSVVTTDGSMAAQEEHTILVTESGAEVLTKRDDELL